MVSKRNVYLKMKTLQEAREIVFDHFSATNVLAVETISVPDAVGRILAEPIYAEISSPNFNAAAMDGLAVRAEKTFGASEINPKELTIGRDGFYVNTGHVLPADTDAVIMIEQVNVVEDNRIDRKKGIACFRLDEFDAVLEGMNRSVIKQAECRWWARKPE